MKFNTALLFLFIGLAIALVGHQNKYLHTFAVLISGIVFIISFLTLFQYIFSFNFGIDNLFFEDTITSTYPGRMSRATALCFLLLSTTKVLRGVKTTHDLKFLNYLVTLVAIISLLVFSTYLLQFVTDNYVLIFNSMALHTAILFFLASLAISLKHPDHSYVGFLTGKYVGNKQARSLLPFVVGLPVILSAALLYFLNSGVLATAYGVTLYTVCFAAISIFYFSFIFQKLNISDQERVKLEEELRASNQELFQYKAALDESSIVTITDVEGAVIYVNKKFEEISGYTKDEVIGKTLEIVNSGHHGDSFFKSMWNTIKAGNVWVGGLKNKKKSGDFYWVHTVIVPLRNTKGEIERYISIKQDITQKTILSNQYKNLKLRNKEVEQFTYLASHDLQEPLRTMKSMSALLKKRYGAEELGEDAKIVDFISDSAVRMSTMVKGLLDYSLIGLDKEPEMVDTAALLGIVKEDIQTLIESKDATITCRDLPSLKAYKTELRLVFQNLLQNSIKFRSPDRELEISVFARKKKESYEFCVQDNGLGIDKDHLSSIFGLFKQLHNKRAFKGTGIGLAHCEKIIHLHGGSIWAESGPAEGTSIYFTIPVF
ncbi:sensor histidine kinase [Marivirga sericea]|nr:ATP-binding protein [Marivirga sericea]